METFEVWEGTEGRTTVRKLIRANAVVQGDSEANAREFFKLDVRNLKHIGDVEISMKDGQSSVEVLGYCWLQQEYSCQVDLEKH